MVLGELFLWQHLWSREHISDLGESLFNLILKINRLIIIGVSLFFYVSGSIAQALVSLPWVASSYISESTLYTLHHLCQKLRGLVFPRWLVPCCCCWPWHCLWRHQVGRPLSHAQGHLGCGHCHCRRGRMVGREQGSGVSGGVSRVVGITSLLPWVGMLESRTPQGLEGPGS